MANIFAGPSVQLVDPDGNPIVFPDRLEVRLDQSTPDANRVVLGGTTFVDVTLSLDTGAYTAGDVLAETQVVSNAMRVAGGTGILQSVVVVDQDDNGSAFDIYLMDANVSMGAENGVPGITDANALKILCKVPVATGDYTDLGGVKVANLAGLWRVIKAATGSRDLWVAVVNGAGTPTYTATGVTLRFGIQQD